MKEFIKMVFILFGLVFANVLVYFYGISTIIVLIVISSSVAAYKAFISEKFSDIYNLHSFKFTITINNVLELIGSFLVSLIVSKSDFMSHYFNIITISLFIITALFIYRFLFFNLSKGTSSKGN